MTIFLFNYNANGGNAHGESRKYVWRCVKGRSAELRPGGVADEARRNASGYWRTLELLRPLNFMLLFLKASNNEEQTA